MARGTITSRRRRVLLEVDISHSHAHPLGSARSVRMPHPSQFKRAAGKKGPRQVTGKRQPKITLRPAPARDPAAPTVDKGKRRAHAAEEEDEGADEDEEPRYGYRESLRGEAKPLEGLRISVSGCSGQKEDLWALAIEYGAERHGGLQEDTTHLIADGRDSAKYKVRLRALARGFELMFLATGRDTTSHPRHEAVLAAGSQGGVDERGRHRLS